jgi:hypothetical protein
LLISAGQLAPIELLIGASAHFPRFPRRNPGS